MLGCGNGEELPENIGVVGPACEKVIEFEWLMFDWDIAAEPGRDIGVLLALDMLLDSRRSQDCV